MKTHRAIPRLLVLCGGLTATSGLGQTVYTWLGAGDGTNLAMSANWTTNGVDPAGPAAFSGPRPNGYNGTGFQDTARWDNLVAGPLKIYYGAASLPNPDAVGINLHITSNQTSPVQIVSSLFLSAYLGINDVLIDSEAGVFTLGDDDTPNNLLTFLRPASGVHHWVNNSTNPATIGRSVLWLGGFVPGYTRVFSGTGDWIVNSYLMDSGRGSFTFSTVQVDGPGTMFWTAGRTNLYSPDSRLGWVAVNGGKLVIKSSDLLTTQGYYAPVQPITNNGTLVFDVVAQSQLHLGVISGTGLLVVSNGTLTLGGASVYTGSTLLAGGTLVVDGPETPGVSGPLGQGNTITFAGGTLGFSTNNSFDYSSRFDTAAGQSYRIDTGGQNVTFTNDLSSSGGTFTKLGVGTLTLAGASSYSGDTTVSAGKLVFQGIKSGTGNINVADGTTLGIVDAGIQVAPDTLTLGTSAGCTLEFNNVTNAAAALLAAATLSSAGTTTVRINSGTLVAGQSYPLLTWTSGAAPTVALAAPSGFSGSLSFAENTLRLNVTTISAPTLSFNRISDELQFTWEQGFGNYKLQAQTNSLNVGLSTNWTDYPGGEAGPVIVPIDLSAETVWFALAPK